LKIVYHADLRRLDTSSNLYDTILRRWADVFEQGVYTWALGEDDNRYEREFQVYIISPGSQSSGFLHGGSDIHRKEGCTVMAYAGQTYQILTSACGFMHSYNVDGMPPTALIVPSANVNLTQGWYRKRGGTVM